MRHPNTLPQIQRILIAKPDRPYGEALRCLCQKTFPQAEISIRCSGLETLRHVQKHSVDLLLLNLHFDDIDGAELLLSINQEYQLNPMIVFIRQRFQSILTALRTARVNAIIDGNTESLSTVRQVLKTINQGGIYISPSLKNSLWDHLDDSAMSLLSIAEIRVLQVIGTGCNNQEGASVLGLKESTVQTHRRNIMNKLNISTSAKLVSEAIRLGIVRITATGIVSPFSIPANSHPKS